ncbi:TPA: leucine-rich repeat protein [Salmonella enterica subsp. enterica serovar Typhi str. AG3]|nr:leucine-rich repeat protein [Salmonella enterica subsp. enterica serovar Typhi str. AG3]
MDKKKRLSRVTKGGAITALLVSTITPSLVLNVESVHAAESNLVTDFTYTIADGQVTITSYLGTSTDVIIPATIEDLPVTVIGEGAFTTAENSDLGKTSVNITSVVIPSTIKTIEKAAFSGVQLTSINLPEGLETIGEGAFSGLPIDVTLPSTLSKIGDFAFVGSGITALNFVNKDVEIGSTAFASSNLKTITVDGGSFSAGMNAFASTNLDSATFANGDFTPGDFAFVGSSIGELTIAANSIMTGEQTFYQTTIDKMKMESKGDIKLGEHAFDSSTIKTVEAFEAGRNILLDDFAFSGASIDTLAPITGNAVQFDIFSFDTADLPALTVNAVEYVDFGRYAFGNVNLTDISITADKIVFGEWSFRGSEELATLDLNAKSIDFGRDSFYENKALKELILDTEKVTIDESAFAYSGVEKVNLKTNELLSIGKNAFNYGKVTELVIETPKEILIGEYAFSYMENMNTPMVVKLFGKSINLADNAFGYSGVSSFSLESEGEVRLGDFALAYTEGLKTIDIQGESFSADQFALSSSSVEDINIAVNSSITLGQFAISESPSLTNLELTGKSLATGDYVFDNTALSEVNLSFEDNLFLGKYAFTSNSQLKDVSLSSNNLNISSYAFYEDNIENLTLDGVKTIGSYAFKQNKLTSLTLPASLLSVGEEAFARNNLGDVKVYNPALAFGVDVFSNNSIDGSFDSKLVVLQGKPGSTTQPYALEKSHTFKAFWVPVSQTTPVSDKTIQMDISETLDINNYITGDIDSYSVISDSANVEASVDTEGIVTVNGKTEGVANVKVSVLGKDGDTLEIPIEVTVVENENLLPPKLKGPAVTPITVKEGESTPSLDLKSSFDSKVPDSLNFEVIAEPNGEIVDYTLTPEGLITVTGIKRGTTSITIQAKDDNGVGDSITLDVTVQAAYGTVTVEYVDTEGKLLDIRTVNNIAFGQYTSEAKAITGYTVIGDTTKSVTLTPASPTATLRFEYKANPTSGSGGGTSGGSGGSSPSTPNPTTPLTSLSVVKYLDKSDKMTVANKGIVLPLTKLDIALKENVLQFSMKSEDKKIDLLRNPVVIELDKDSATLNANKKEFASTIDLSKVDLAKVRLGREEEEGKYTAIPHFVKDNKIIVTTSHVDDIVLIKEQAKEFKDIDEVFSKNEITKLQNFYIVNGTTSETYSPWSSITRGQFAGMIASALELEPLETEKSKYQFRDVAKQWYADDVQALSEAGIINGYEDGRFGGQDNLTRQQAMAIIGNALKYVGVSTKTSNKIDVEDYNNISGYARESINFLAEKGILQEGDGIKFNPQNKLNRAQMAGVLMKALELSDWY